MIFYIKEIFHKTTNLTHRPFNIKVNQNNTTKYGNKSLRSLGSHVLNSLSRQIKKNLIKINLKIILVNGLVQFMLFIELKIWNYIQHNLGFDTFGLETVLQFMLVVTKKQHLVEFSPVVKVSFKRTKRGDFYTHYIAVLAYVVISTHFIWKLMIWRLSSGKIIILQISLICVLNHFLINCKVIV